MNHKSSIQKDIRGLDLTAQNSDAVAQYDKTIDRFFEYRTSTMKELKSIFEIDPHMPMAHCLQGYLFRMIGTNAVQERVAAALAGIESQAERLLPRESMHSRALRAWMNGDDVSACHIWYTILNLFPHDILAMKLLHTGAFWMGNSGMLRDSVACAFLGWHPDDPGYSHVLGMYAFGLEEAGEYQRAETMGLQAVEMNPDDLWALHAVAHVYEMQSRLREGQALLARPADTWIDRNPFRGHVWWHAAMFELELGNYDRVLAIYDDLINVKDSTFYLDVQNTASLLMRLKIRRVDIAGRFHELADIAERQIGDHVLAFTEMHYAMALAADDRTAVARNHLDSLASFSRKRNNWSAAVMAMVGNKLCRLMGNYTRGDHDGFIDSYMPVRYDIPPVGGSHAQRDVFDQMLVDSAINAKRLHLALALVSERISRRPESPYNWRWYAEINKKLGNTDIASHAAEKYRSLCG